jgi:tetratricopeptide (TPR) repeat protein
MKNKRNLYQLIYKTLPALLIIFTIYTVVMPKTAFAFVESATAPEIETIDQDDFDKKFREGRDLIDREEWARAAEKFREAVETYPNGKSADAALYWLAFCHKKQKQFKEANSALDRLMEKFPTSSWSADARVMKVEIAPSRAVIYSPAATGFNYPAAAPATTAAAASNSLYNGTAPLNTAQTYVRSGELIGILNDTSARAPLDREDEIKIAAFQSLLSADPKRAIETMGDILRTDSKASETLKQEVVRVLRAPRWSGTQAIGLAGSGSIIEKGLGKEFVPLIRDALIKGFQNVSSIKLRKEIIYSLANLADDQSIDFLKKRYADENDREIKKAIIGAFSSSSNVLYAFSSNNSTFAGLNNSSRAQTRKTEFNFLMEIVRTEKDTELRRLAFANLQRFQNWAADVQMMEMVSSLYDSETDEAFKISIIRSLTAARQNQATRKLLDIARSEKSDKLKLEAIYALRSSKDPEVLRFLEDLIK